MYVPPLNCCGGKSNSREASGSKSCGRKQTAWPLPLAPPTCSCFPQVSAPLLITYFSMCLPHPGNLSPTLLYPLPPFTLCSSSGSSSGPGQGAHSGSHPVPGSNGSNSSIPRPRSGVELKPRQLPCCCTIFPRLHPGHTMQSSLCSLDHTTWSSPQVRATAGATESTWSRPVPKSKKRLMFPQCWGGEIVLDLNKYKSI